MTNADSAHAIIRMKGILERRPSFGLQADSLATAEWRSGFSVASLHPNGSELMSDMPVEFGGEGSGVTPGWFLRAGIAACTLTCVLICASRRGTALSKLKIEVSSRSDNRALFGVTESDGSEVNAAPVNLHLAVEISSDHADAAELRALVEEGYRCSYAAQGVALERPLTMSIDCP